MKLGVYADRARTLLRGAWERDDIQFVFHGLLLVGLMVILRPMFTLEAPTSAYEAKDVFWAMIRDDINLLKRAARSKRPAVPSVLFLIVPTALILLARARITWERWTHGKELRLFVIALLAMLAWSGSTFDYNIYLNRGHFADRALVVALVVLSWRTPLAVPFAVRWVWIMIRESYVPFAHDDFDFRAVHEVLIVFSCFVWMSFMRSFRASHFMLVGLGAWASYYFSAGVAKLDYGPSLSWLLENHLSSLSFGSYVRGWLGFVSEETFIAMNGFVRNFDRFLAFFTMVFEIGTIVGFFMNRRMVQIWSLLAVCFHFGIFVLTGIFFWKWMFANAMIFAFATTVGAPVIEEMCRHKLVLLAAVVMVFFAGERVYFYPQTRVVWYDTKIVEDYTLQAIGASGESYLVSPDFLTPMEMPFVMGRLCFATNERMITGIYGVTWSYDAMKQLDTLKDPEDALKVVNRGRRCNDPKGRRKFEEFFKRYFGNLNKHGRPHRWLSWIGRPTHLWIFTQGELYDMQEPVERIELWREVVVNQGGAVHRLDKRRVKTVEIPE